MCEWKGDGLTSDGNGDRERAISWVNVCQRKYIKQQQRSSTINKTDDHTHKLTRSAVFSFFCFELKRSLSLTLCFSFSRSLFLHKLQQTSKIAMKPQLLERSKEYFLGTPIIAFDLLLITDWFRVSIQV